MNSGMPPEVPDNYPYSYSPFLCASCASCVLAIMESRPSVCVTPADHRSVPPPHHFESHGHTHARVSHTSHRRPHKTNSRHTHHDRHNSHTTLTAATPAYWHQATVKPRMDATATETSFSTSHTPQREDEYRRATTHALDHSIATAFHLAPLDNMPPIASRNGNHRAVTPSPLPPLARHIADSIPPIKPFLDAGGNEVRNGHFTRTPPALGTRIMRARSTWHA
jgi:hypothetical protein